MNNLINVKVNEDGNQIVSAKELYLGLGLNKTNWSRWYPKNIQKNEFFKENIDWLGVRHYDEGNETMDFAITLEFAKHIAMMAKTKKSHEYRNYFIECENKLKSGQANNFKTTEELLIYQLQEQLKVKKQLNEVNHRALEAKNKVEKLDKKVDDKFGELPLFTVDSKALSKLANSKMTAVLGGKKSPAYKKLNRKGWADLYGQVHREFGVSEIGAIKRKDLEKARQVIIDYVLPTHLKEQVEIANNQIEFEEAN